MSINAVGSNYSTQNLLKDKKVQENEHIRPDEQVKEFLNDIPTDKVGTTSTRVARKGVKYVWHKFIDYLSELFNKKTTEENQSPKYDYQA